MNVFIAWDGDHIGRQVGRASLADNVEELRRISQAIDQGNAIWKSWVELAGGSIVSFGGDEGRAEVPAEKLQELPKIRVQYSGAVGSSVSVGVGLKLSEADRALLAAKLRGGDKIVFYTSEVDQDIERAKKPQNESEKLFDEYLGKAQANEAMNDGAFQGAHKMVGPAKAVQPQEVTDPENSETAAAVDTFDAERPPESSQTHAAQDFENQFHDAAGKQKEQDDAEAAKQNSNIEQLKAQVVQVLQQVKGQQQVLEQIRQQAPDVYNSVMGMAQAMVALARELVSGDEEQPMQKSEDEEDGEPQADLFKDALPSTGRHPLKLPVGATIEGQQKFKVQHQDGTTSWKSAKAGIIQSQDPTGHGTSAREPGAR